MNASEVGAGGGGAEPPLVVRRLTLNGFRSFERAVLEPCPRLNVVSGDNGQGKTSLLEALYFAATTRSFRAEKLAHLVRTGTHETWVRAEISEHGRGREQLAALSGSLRRVQLDGKRPERLVDYAQRTPVVAFHPGDLSLVAGAASLRRRLLDRVALFVDPAGYERKARYERTMKARQCALEERGERAADLDAFEVIAAEEGARYQAARAEAAARLQAAALPAFSRLVQSSLALTVRYRPGGSLAKEEFLRELFARRVRDRARGSPSFGPGKDELELELDGQAARSHGSQGQQRVVTLALKLGELDCIAQARELPPVLLLDDVSSELDPTRTGAVYDVLLGSQSQVFVTTTRPELFPMPSGSSGMRSDFVVEKGAVRRVPDPG